jgi:hypothetical protein
VGFCYWAVTGGFLLLGCKWLIGVTGLIPLYLCYLGVTGGLLLLCCNWWFVVT